MLAEIHRELRGFSSAVLTARDAEGYPFSLRCHPRADAPNGALQLDVADELPARPGPASLLCHRHDERLWRQRSFLVRGTLERDGAGWRFRPGQLIRGVGYGGIVGLIRFVVEARRKADDYLARRGRARPRVPWHAINAVKARARRRPNRPT